jgi:hypothetical protein
MATLIDVVRIWQDIAEDHKQIRAFYDKRLSEVDIPKLADDKYPLLYAQVTEVEMDSQSIAYSFEVVVAELVIEQVDDELNRILHETQLICQDVLAAWAMNINYSASHSNYVKNWNINYPISLQPFEARFSNLLAGWMFNLEIVTPQGIDFCNALYAN